MLKKVTLTILIATVCLLTKQTVFAQVNGVSLYSWDFANGIPATWTLGSTTNVSQWEYRGPNTVPNFNTVSRGSCGGGALPFTSVTQTNGFIVFDSNYWDDNDNQCGGFGTGPDPAPHDAWIITNSFSLQGITGAAVTFQQQFRNYSATVKVAYSIDNGTNWIDMLTQTNVFPSVNAEWKTANFPAGAIGQANVKLRFKFTGTYYHWAIDDINVYKPSINNLVINNTRYYTYGNTTPTPPNNFHDLPYDIYPTSMLVPFKFSAKATNIGSASQTLVNLNAKVLNSANTALFNQTTANQTITAGNTGTFTITATYTPSTTTGYFRIPYSIAQSQTDEAPNNNKDTLDFNVHAFQYARDEGPMEDVYDPSALFPNSTFQIGNVFEARLTGITCQSVGVAVGTGTAIGTQIRAKIYRTDFTQLVATSETYSVNAWDINSVGQQKLITLHLPSALSLSNDSLYFVMVENINANEALRVCRSGPALDETSYIRNPNTSLYYFLAKIPVVRMNLFTSTTVAGCTNPLANNFVSSATTDDGSCDIPGCIYTTAPNYNPSATWYDGSCIIYGCTISTACNYNPTATVNDGTCILPVTYYIDADGDSFGNPANPTSACSQPSGYVTNNSDCNDSNINIKPTATETCNNIDDNCNGQIDEGFTAVIYYADADIDGYGNPAISASSCAAVPGYVTNNSDCNDANNLINPARPELCNNIDDNCNSQIDDGLTFLVYYIDADNDGYGNSSTATSSCTPLQGYVLQGNDCNDNNAARNPGMPELCNNIDDNCNSQVDDGLIFLNYYVDTDLDGYGAGSSTFACTSPGANYVTNNSDCNNTNALINPSRPEICNTIDDNCNALVDDGLTFSNYYLDADADGFYLSFVNACVSPGANYTISGGTLGDCNDNNPNIHVGATEICGNAIDEDCSGSDLTCVVLGCTNPVALNFNPLANTNDGSCIILGCMDSNADNYNPIANQNGFCIYYGCTDEFANNYDPTANTNDNTCQYNTASISLSSSSSCVNGTVTVFNLTAYQPEDDCIINFGDGNTFNGCQATYTHSYAGAGSYNVSMTYIQGSNTSTSNTPTVIVNNNPAVPTLTYNSGFLQANYGIGLTLNWSLNGSSLNNSFNPIIPANLSANPNGYYSATVTNTYGCSATSAQQLIIFPSFTSSSQINCTPSEVTFVNTTPSFAGLTCELNTGYNNETFPLESQLTYTYSTAGYYTPFLTCQVSSNYFQFTGEQIIALETPAAPVIIDQTPTQVTIANPNSSMVQWLLNGTALNNNSNTLTFNGNGIYSVYLLNEYGCNSDTTSLEYVLASASLSNTTGCAPLSIQFENTTDNLDLGISCYLQFSDADDAIPFDGTLNYSYSNAGTFAPIITCYYGNTYSVVELSNVQVFPAPATPLLSWNYGQVQITNNANNDLANWYLFSTGLNQNGNTISTLFNGAYQNGEYTATLTNEYGCSATSDPITVIQPAYQLTNNSGCGPLNTTVINNTDPLAGLTCTLSADGILNYSPFTLPQNFTYNLPGTYHPSISCTYNGNTYTYNTGTVTVYNNPAPPILSSTFGQIQVVNAEIPSSVVWSIDQSVLPIQGSPLNTFINGVYQNGYYVATVTNANGCTTTSAPLLVLQPTFSVQNNNGCPPLSPLFTNTTDPVDGMVCYMISPNNIYSLLSPSTTINYSNSGDFAPVISCEVNGQTYTATGDTVHVYPVPSPPDLTWTYGSILCSNCGTSQIQLLLDATYITTAYPPVSTYFDGNYQNGNYAAKIQNAEGCWSAGSDPLLVVQPVLTLDATTGCAPLPENFTNNTDPINNLNCELTLGNGLGTVPLTFGEVYNYSYANSGSFEPTLTCFQGNFSFSSPAQTVVALDGITPEIQVQGGVVSCINCPNQDNVTWVIDGTLIIDSTLQVNESLGTHFNIEYANESGCIGDNFYDVSITELNALNDLHFYPNPSNGLITVTGLRAGDVLEIYDSMGRRIAVEKVNGQIETLDLSYLANGAYHLIQKTKETSHHGTLFVNR